LKGGAEDEGKGLDYLDRGHLLDVHVLNLIGGSGLRSGKSDHPESGQLISPTLRAIENYRGICG
jgi:hypothetical protein